MGIIVAVDIGGTQIRAATYSSASHVPLKHLRISTNSNEGDVFDRLVSLIEAAWPEDKADAISAAIPGPVDPQSGLVIDTPNIPGWDNYPLGEKLAKKFKVPVFLGNDANLAALGEWRFGAGQGHHNLLYLTISTGIGGGVINDDRLLLGCRGMAAELGHVTVLPDGPVCSCGQRGHLESIASGPAITRFVNEKLSAGRPSILKSKPSFTALDIAEAARQGDELANYAFRYAGEYLGQALADFLHMFNPSIVIFGGGVSLSGPLLLEPVKESVKRHVMTPSYLEGLELTLAKLGDDAGLLGALAQGELKLWGA